MKVARFVRGIDAAGDATQIAIVPAPSDTTNPAFDVTPRRLGTGLITERGVLCGVTRRPHRLVPRARGGVTLHVRE